jgi:flagellin
MSSILTNTSAMTALQTLNQTMKSMQTTQNQISTGLRISSASDNAAYWSIATTMRQDSSALSTVSDALALGGSTMEVANNGLSSAIDVVGQIKNALASATQPGIDRTKVQGQITQLQKQLKSIADTASFNGQNFLSVDSSAAGFNSTKSVISSYSRDSTGAISVGMIDLDISSIKLFDQGSGTVHLTAPTGLKGSGVDSGGTIVTGDLAFSAAANGGAGGFTVTDNSGTVTDLAGAAPQNVTLNGSKVTSLAFNTGTSKYDVTYQGGGLLDTTDTSTVGSYTDSAGNTTTVTGTSASVANLDISNLDNSAASLAKLNAIARQVDSALSAMTSAASDLGSVKSRIASQQSFVSSLKITMDEGVGSLVDADMNAASTKLQALQVQQQLGIQSLSIANQSSQLILKLFG